MNKPWSGVMPAADEAAFNADGDQSERPMEVGERPALIVVDMTRAFVDSKYPRGWSPTGYPAVAANKTLLAAARDAGIPIFFTKARLDGAPAPTPAERGRGRHRPVADPAIDSLPPGDVIVDDLTPRPGELVIPKGSKPSGFFGTQLASFLTFHGIDTTIISGMSTSGCVRATVVDACQYNYHVVVPFECCADRSQLSHKVNLFDIHMKYADVVSLQEVLDYLARCTRSAVLQGATQTR